MRCFRPALVLPALLLTAIGLSASDAALAAARKKPSKKIPAVIVIDNKRSVELVEFSLSAAGTEGKTLVSLKKPVPGGKTLTIPLKGLKSCLVSIAGTFADQAESDSETDVCADKVVRFTD